MVAAVLATALVATLALVGVTAVEGDVNITQNDLAHKQAFEAAKAGIDYYSFHLNADNTYWTHCTEVPAPSAVNQQGSTTNRRTVPGDSAAAYAIELIPATGQSSCNPKNAETATTSMIEQSGLMAGSFRIRSTGFYENDKVSIVATFKRASFLDYMYFTQLETSDPVTYENEATVKGAYEQCTLTYEQGRYNKPIPNSGGEYCDKISFVSADTINGPVHTNDAFAICGNTDLWPHRRGHGRSQRRRTRLVFDL